MSGGVDETTELLQQRFDHIVFTGSPRVGKIVMAAASKHLTPCTLELGGKWFFFVYFQIFSGSILNFSPTVVEPDADIQITARRLAWGKWLNVGQTCLAPDYVLCNPETKQRLVEELGHVINDFYQNDPENSTDYSHIIDRPNFEYVNIQKKMVLSVDFQSFDRYSFKVQGKSALQRRGKLQGKTVHSTNNFGFD